MKYEYEVSFRYTVEFPERLRRVLQLGTRKTTEDFRRFARALFLELVKDRELCASYARLVFDSFVGQGCEPIAGLFPKSDADQFTILKRLALRIPEEESRAWRESEKPDYVLEDAWDAVDYAIRRGASGLEIAETGPGKPT